MASSVDLAICVARTMAAAHPLAGVAGVALGGVMALGTAVWCGLKYGPGGKRR